MTPAEREPGLTTQLRSAIERSGLSLNDIAKASGIDSGRLSRFMRGERDLTLSAADRICDALHLVLGPRRRTEKEEQAPKG